MDPVCLGMRRSIINNHIVKEKSVSVLLGDGLMKKDQELQSFMSRQLDDEELKDEVMPLENNLNRN